MTFYDNDLRDSNVNLAVYTLSSTNGWCGSTGLDYLSVQEPSDVDFRLISHPCLPISMFVSGDHLYLWYLDKGRLSYEVKTFWRGRLRLINLSDYRSLTPIMEVPELWKPAANSSLYGSRLSQLEAIGFSQCGEFYTVKLRSEVWPAIYPLPIDRDAVYLDSAQPLKAESLPLIRKRKAQDELTQGTWSKDLALSGSPILDANMVSVNRKSFQISSTIIVPKHASRKLEIRFLANVENTASIASYNLLSLPRGIDLNNHTITASWPSDPEGKIRIILSKNSPPFYEATDTSDCQAAILVDRDPHSLRRVETSLLT